MLNYQPLVDAQIRLITIKPGSLQNEIKCGLTTVSLDDRPSYDALQYVWNNPKDDPDNPKDTWDVLVDGAVFTATRNLL